MSDSVSTPPTTLTCTSPTSEPAATSTPDSPPPPAKAYVPPHLRCKMAEIPAASELPPFVPTDLRKTTFSSSEIYKHFGVIHGGTINPSINDHREMSFILIFQNQHPQYPPNIFVKSHLQLIFQNPEEGEELNPALKDLEIPLFEEERAYGRKLFRFKSWVKVQKAERLEKGSEALIEMLMEKWRSDTPRRSGFEMREREKSKKENVKAVTTSVEVNNAGDKTTVENKVYSKDDDDSDSKLSQQQLEKEAKAAKSFQATGTSLQEKLEGTIPRSEMAWKNSLSVDWGIVTLEFINNGKENPLYGPSVKLLPAKMPSQESIDKLGKDLEELLKKEDDAMLQKLDKSLEDGKNTVRGQNGKKADKVPLSKILQTDGADDMVTVMINDDLDSASIPSSPVLEPATPKKGSAVNLSTYSLKSDSNQHQDKEKGPAAGGLAVSHSDISQSYISTGMGESIAEDFGTISASSETEAEESDRWSELSDHERPEDENWMAVERGGMAKEVY